MAIILTCISILDTKTLGMNQQESSLVRAQGRRTSDVKNKELGENRKGVLGGVIATLIGVIAVTCVAALVVHILKKNNNKVKLDPSIEAEFNKSNAVIDSLLLKYSNVIQFEKTSNKFKKLKVGLVKILEYKNQILAAWSKTENKELFDHVKNFINSLESGKIMVRSEHNQYYLIFGNNDDEGELIYIDFRTDFNNAICFVYRMTSLLGMYDNGNCYTVNHKTLEQTNN